MALVQSDLGETWIDTHAYEDGPEPVVTSGYTLSDKDVALIAAMRNALSALLDLWDAARAQPQYNKKGIRDALARLEAL